MTPSTRPSARNGVAATWFRDSAATVAAGTVLMIVNVMAVSQAARQNADTPTAHSLRAKVLRALSNNATNRTGNSTNPATSESFPVHQLPNCPFNT